jgi:hypothetical protein
VKKNAQWFGVAVLVAAGVVGCSSAPPDDTPQVWEIPQDWATPTSTNQAFAPPISSTSTNAAIRAGKAIVRSKHGEIEIANDGVIRPMSVNMELLAGTIIKTTTDSEAYLQVNGFTSTVKLVPNTVAEINRMEQRGEFAGGDSYTVLTLRIGSILGSVRKISADSLYEIRTPNGVARIRGTDFQIAATPTKDGKFRVSYTSVTGQIVVSAMVNGVEVTKALTTNQEWVPGEGEIKNLPEPHYYPTDRYLPPPVFILQPFNGNGPPNPAVDAGQNPYAHGAPPPPPRPIPGPSPSPGTSGMISARHR